MASAVKAMTLRLPLHTAGILALVLMPSYLIPTEARACGEWQKGFSFWSRTIQYNSPEAFDSLLRLKATGANYVSPIVTLYVDNAYDPNVKRSANTPSDAELAAFADKAHELGLKVFLKIHVDSLDNTWRGFLNPYDKQAWFASYSPFVDHYADLAADRRIEGLAVGAELVGLSGPQYTKYWKDIIARSRARYSGFLTYSANWGGGIADQWPDWLEEFTKIEFWPDLDYLGISAYFELSKQDYPSKEDLFRGWDRWFRSRIAPFQAAQAKPVLITEVGYKSTVGAAGRPWDNWLVRDADPKTQAELYEVFFKFWSKVPWLHGAYFWNWGPTPSNETSQDVDYTPQNKPAEKIITSWFGRPDWLALDRWALLDDVDPLKLKQEGPFPNVAMNSSVAKVWAFLGQLDSCRAGRVAARPADSESPSGVIR